jgi:RimJ/RimL family protein N-acetyltransferase
MDLELVTTPRLRLERWNSAHTGALVEMNLQPAVMRYLNEGQPVPAAASREQSERFADHWERFGFGLWAVVDGTIGETVGFGGLSHPLWFPDEAGEVEIGWRLHPSAWGKGFATEVGRAGLEAAFGELGRHHVVSYIHVDNEPSKAVSRRLGMTRERTIAHPTREHRLEVYVVGGP